MLDTLNFQIVNTTTSTNQISFRAVTGFNETSSPHSTMILQPLFIIRIFGSFTTPRFNSHTPR